MAELVKDVVCGMEIDPETAAGKSEHEGTTYHFCAEGCKQEFDTNPQKFLDGGEAEPAPAAEAVPAAAEASSGSSEKRWWEFWKS
ncbi:MAG: YHS domain-containing protein [Chloroflexi bacterium]|nr:YHS domain-containing protein [Chloroflexota bacterium]